MPRSGTNVRAVATVPPSGTPVHLAVIMDGNGRWAQQRHRPRTFGHHAGVRRARNLIAACSRRGIRYLSLFVFSRENWQRPQEEVGLLMQLLAATIARKVQELHSKGISVRFIGAREDFAAPLRRQMQEAEALTATNPGLKLFIAAGYSGRWDIVQAARSVSAEGRPLTEQSLSRRLATASAPEPDLLIRTGGERRLSNFMLWQMGYTELYFADTLWPDFGASELDAALQWYAGRQRRFGRVGRQ